MFDHSAFMQLALGCDARACGKCQECVADSNAQYLRQRGIPESELAPAEKIALRRARNKVPARMSRAGEPATGATKMANPATTATNPAATTAPKRERKPPKQLTAPDAIGQIGKLLDRVPESDRKRVLAFFTVA